MVSGYIYFIHINGLYGRKRKVQRDTLKLVEFAENLLNPEELETATKAFLTQIGAKTGMTYSVTEQPVTREITETGFVVTHYTNSLSLMGSAAKLLTGTVA